jgi:hypothetical protein
MGIAAATRQSSIRWDIMKRNMCKGATDGRRVGFRQYTKKADLLDLSVQAIVWQGLLFKYLRNAQRKGGMNIDISIVIRRRVARVRNNGLVAREPLGPAR